MLLFRIKNGSENQTVCNTRSKETITAFTEDSITKKQQPSCQIIQLATQVLFICISLIMIVKEKKNRICFKIGFQETVD